MSTRVNLFALSTSELIAHIDARRGEGSTAVAVIAAPVAPSALALAPRSKRLALSYRGFDDFMPAFRAAREAARAAFGERWYFNPDACLGARVPAAWVQWRVGHVSGKSPRDLTHFPLGRFWPGGVLPVGPEYSAPVSAAQFAAPPPRRRLTIEAAEWELVADVAD